MGMFADFMGIFKTSTKAVDTAADIAKMGAKGIDAMWYTDEEKAGDTLKHAENKLEWGKVAVRHIESSLNESSARSLSRRYLAWGSFALGFFLTLYALLIRTIALFWAKGIELADGSIIEHPIHTELIKVSDFALGLLNIWWPIILAGGTFYLSAALVRAWGKK